MSYTRINLRSVTSLLVDSEAYTRGLVAQMLRGFEMETPTQVSQGAAAKAHLQHQCPDICLIEAVLPDMSSVELIRWIRRLKGPVRFVPVIVLTGYTQLRTIALARDSGANLVVRKPVSPKALFDRMLWIARSARPFIESDNFIGPDRRFRTIEPPDGKFKRDLDDPTLVHDTSAEDAETSTLLSKITQQANRVA
ncbi:MAG: response regulator [Rhizomicrobium sp.]|jgi:DNA-binding response OmpR family regulator